MTKAAVKKPRAPRKPKPPKAPPLTPEQKEQVRWQKAADRERARAMKKHPLFVMAGIVVLPTPEEKRARHEAAMAQMEADWAARQAALDAAIVEARNAFVAVASAEQIAAFEAGLKNYPRESHPNRYRDALRELHGLPDPTAHAAAEHQVAIADQKRRRREARPIMPSLFPGENERWAERLAARARGDDPLPDGCATETKPPCPSCGWDRKISSSTITLNVHPPQCPALRGLLLGMAKNCKACKGLPYGCCQEHLDDVLACDQEGHVPYWPTEGYRSLGGHPYCKRCDRGLPLDALPRQAA